jgi:hypothetical protein
LGRAPLRARAGWGCEPQRAHSPFSTPFTCRPSLCKLPLLLGGVLPLVLFVTGRPVAAFEEALLEYGRDWYTTYLKYYPAMRPVFYGVKEDRAQVSY